MSLARRLLLAAAACSAFGVASASASLLPVSSARMGSGDSSITRCDTDGVSVSYASAFDTTAADYRTSSVTVSGIAPACAARTIRVTARNAAAASLWQGTATVAGTTATITTTAIQSSAIAGWAVTITG